MDQRPGPEDPWGVHGEVRSLLSDPEALEGFVRDAIDELTGSPTGVQLPGDLRLMAVGDLHGHLGAALWVANRLLGDEGLHLVGLGDYVDRGPRQLETLLVMLALHRRCPGRATLLRGNHETERFARSFGFRDRVGEALPAPFYELFMDLFEHLPLFAHREDGVLLLHGGIPAGARTVTELAALPKGGRDALRPEVEEVLLNDPAERLGRHAFNFSRGIGNTFGLDATRDFMDRSSLWLVVRGHEAVPGGARWSHGDRVLSVFSHPDYQGRGDDGAVAIIGGRGQVDLEVITPVPI